MNRLLSSSVPPTNTNQTQISMFALNSFENGLLLLHHLPKFTTVTNTKTHLRLHHQYHRHPQHRLKAHFKSTTLPLPLSSPTTTGSSTLIVDFLMDSGGLSYVQAIKVIRKVPSLSQNGGRKPRSVIAYLESIGFSKTHISKVISNFPKVLVADVENTLKPKIQLFQDDFGFSESDIVDLVTSNPTILHHSLKKQIKPALDFIKRFVKTDEDLIKTFKRYSSYIVSENRRKSIEPNIEPNIDVLRQHGVPDSEIVIFTVSRLKSLMWKPEEFKRIVKRVVSLGFKPETKRFSSAVVVMCGMSKATWDPKVDLLKGLGWSEVQILDTFRRNPRFLALSRKKLKESIEFFKESLNWDASVISQHPIILNYSLKVCVIPKCAVLKCLMSKEIIKEDTVFISMLMMNETDFLSKYVFKYQDQLPHLYEVYKKECMLGCKEDDGDIDMTV